ncbi:MAG: LPS assembly protein LptD [Pseudomonadota bacterium]
MRLTARAIALLACLMLGQMLLCQGAQAQDLEVDRDQPVALVADEVTYESETGRLIAEGNVEVFYGERTLTADRIVYDDATGRISAEGEIVLRDPTGTTVYADVIDLDADLRDGLVRGAQSLIGTQGKIAAVEGRRVEDRYNVLSKAVYSPCEVCSDQPTPLWRIRARKIIHDEEEKQVHYENAWFDLLGVPVLWTPYFRHPDPTVERASGFLAPSFKQSSNYGYGARFPYFWVIDEQSDLTVAPFFTTNEGVIGEAEYRRAFSNGQISIGGSVTRSDFNDRTGFEGHLDTKGLFSFRENAKWGWNVRVASDDAYLRFFDFSNEDRLESESFLFNYGENGFYDARVVRFQSLRDDEPAGQIPFAVPDFSARYELPDPWLKGEFGFFADSAALLRTNGADTARISFGVDWERQMILSNGLSLTAFAEARGDIFTRRDDPGLSDLTSARFAPLAGIEARYPLIWEQKPGTAHIIEPIAQAIAAPFGGNDNSIVSVIGPNGGISGVTFEDSGVTEFDETNLFDRNHFSGLDGFEEGPRFNLGLRYARVSDDGIKVDATVGRVLRLRDADEFSPGTGLTDAQSDWVAAWAVGIDPYVTVRQRLRFDDDLTVNRNEVGMMAEYGRLRISGDYVFLESDPLIGEPLDREEFSVGASIGLSKNWRIRGFVQRDLQEREFVETGGGITYANECCEVDVFLRRRFTDSDDVPAATSVGVQVKLLTLGASDTDLFGGTGRRSNRTLGSNDRDPVRTVGSER